MKKANNFNKSEKRLNHLDRIAKDLGRYEIWGNDQKLAFNDNLDSNLEILKQTILNLKIDENDLN
jgi:hypothetical protein